MSSQVTRGSDSAPYRGEDRRRVAGPVQSPSGRPFLLAFLLACVLFALMSFVADVPMGWRVQAGELVQVLQVASFMIAAAVAVLAISRWYLTSDAPALWIGVAFALYGVARLGVAELLPLVVTGDTTAALAAWVRPASQLLLLFMLLRAAITVPVASNVSGPRLLAGAIVALAGLTLLMRLLPEVATVIDGAASALPRSYSVVNQAGLVPLTHLALAAVYIWQGHRRQRWMFAWLGLLLVTLALGDLARVLAPPPIESGLLGKEALRLLSLLYGLNGATREMLYTYRDSSTRLARSEYTAMTAQELIRSEHALAEERAHEARSALAAIEGATKTLEHYRDRLPPETQAALSTAVSGEIRRLQRLVSVEEPAGDIEAFSLAEALGPVVASERARGILVDVDVAGDLDVIGRPGSTEQVLQTLFDNARRYAPGSPVAVRAHREGQWVVMRVEDRGPGVPEQEREAIFRRGVRGQTASNVRGSGLGLFVAAKLMQDQAGRLWVDDRDGGGASFALALPADTDSSAVTTFDELNTSGAQRHRAFRVFPRHD
jgi:two-component system, OmpR family, sensor kinase